MYTKNALLKTYGAVISSEGFAETEVEKSIKNRFLLLFCLLTSILFCLAAATNTASAATYYLDAVNGDDSNPGTSELPWQTLAKAQSTVTGGDTVYLLSGNYGDFTLANYSNTDWITYKAADGETPIFNYIHLYRYPDIREDAYLKFEGITIINGNVACNIDDTSNLWFLNCTIIGDGYVWNDSSTGIKLTWCRDVIIDGCTIYGTGSGINTNSTGGQGGSNFGKGFVYGVYSQEGGRYSTEHSHCEDITVQNCTMYGLHKGVRASGKGWLITNNEMYYMTADGVVISAANCAAWGTPSDVVVSYNHIHHLGQWDGTLETTVFTGSGLDDLTPDLVNGLAGTSNYDVYYKVQIDGEGTLDTFKWSDDGGETWDASSVNITGSAQTLNNGVKITFNATTGHTADEYWTFTLKAYYRAHNDAIQFNDQETNNVVIRGNKCHDIDQQGFFFQPTRTLEFTSGGTYQPVMYDDITQATSGATATVYSTHKSTGEWDKGTAEGIFRLKNQTGTFQSGNLNINGNSNVCSISGNSTKNENWLIENNLLYNLNLEEGGSAAVRIQACESVVFRNNTIDGSVLGENGYGDAHFASVYGNIVRILDIYTDPPDSVSVTYENYNVIRNKWIHMDNHALGANSILLGTDAAFEALFTDYDNRDFTLTKGSIAIDLGNADYAPNSDILGVSRDSSPDAGCYEYIPADSNNQAPVLQTIGNKSVDENSLLTFTVSATDADGDAITYSIQNKPSGASLDPQTGGFSWTPSYSQTGTYPVTFIATDEHGAKDSEPITITVNNVNQLPVAVDDSATVAEDSGANAIDLLANDSDADGDTLMITAVTQPSHGGVAITGGGTGLTYTPAAKYNGSDSFTYTMSDGNGGADTAAVNVIVNPGNQVPSADAGADQTLTDNDGNGSEQVTLDASGSSDSDGTIIYAWSEGANHITTVQQPTVAVALNVGTHNITLTVTDDDGATDTDMVIITIHAADTTAPSVSNVSPDANSIQAPLNALITLNVEDAGKGVDADSVTIKVNNNTVYSGDTAKYSSAYGDCYRIGTNANYKFIYQSTQNFDFDQTISIAVNAADLAGNAMDEYSYSFTTEMRSFGNNVKVNSNTLSSNGMPVTVRDSGGNIWTAWHTGATGNKDIYINKLTAGSEAFGNSIKLTESTADQRNPAIAVGSDDKLYVAWQDSRGGNWDIYVSTSTDGVNWSAETRVTDSNDNQMNPAIVVDSSLPNNVYVVWEDSRNGNQDIYIGASNNGFVSTTSSQITSVLSYQGEPAIAVDSDNTVYVVWTDKRISGENDIYGAASNNSWNNIPVVTEEGSQSNPAIATESEGSILHIVWVDDRSGDNDIYYAKTNDGLPGIPLTGSNTIDDTTGADQSRPVIAVVGSTTDSNLQVFACWQDERNEDDDLYLTELSSGSGTNILVGDNSTNAHQSEPAIGIDEDGRPYLVWTDSRNANTDIYHAGSTSMDSDALASANISPSSTVTVGTSPSSISSADDVSVVVPTGAYPCDIKITISKIVNPLAFTLPCLCAYDFGPSNIEFTQPVTVTIPYNYTGSEDVALTYWYNSLTDALSQQGITDVTTITVSSTVHALRFKTTHFTPFYVFLGSAAASSIAGGGGGGGGCSMSPNSQASVVEMLLPYIGLTVAMVALKLRDRRKRKARNITKSGC